MKKAGIIGGTGLIGGYLKHYFANREDSATAFGGTLFESEEDLIVNSYHVDDRNTKLAIGAYWLGMELFSFWIIAASIYSSKKQ